MLLFAAVLYLGRIAQAVLFMAAAGISVYEMYGVMKKKGYRPFMLPGYLFAALYCWAWYFWADAAGLALLWAACFMLVIVERICSRTRTTEDCIASASVLLYPLPLYVFLMLLGLGFSKPLTLTGLVMTFAGPLLADTVAYFVGTLFGKHKLCPAISPKKTVEGSVGSLFGGVLGGLAVFFLQKIWQGATPLLPLLLRPQRRAATLGALANSCRRRRP